ncbi:hypothetical protein BC830DRAFT_1141774 [Chytriomyces sp. MP71]|nr:hypothetical protein BC830DRAFT_1141774 [Chytriomyces sp. MP71]
MRDERQDVGRLDQDGFKDRDREHGREYARNETRAARRRDSRSRSPQRSYGGGRDRYDDRRGGDRFDDRRDQRRDDRDRRPQRRYISPSQRGTPEPSKVLGVFGLSILTKERDLDKLFGEFGRIDEISILFDKQTGKSRGFGFITFDNLDAAAKARDAMNGYEYNERRMRVDYSLTKKGHESTPGQYMGRPDQVNRRSSRDDGYSSRGGDRDRASLDRDRGGDRDRASLDRDRDRAGGFRSEDRVGHDDRASTRDDRGSGDKRGYRDYERGGDKGYRDDDRGAASFSPVRAEGGRGSGNGGPAGDVAPAPPI